MRALTPTSRRAPSGLVAGTLYIALAIAARFFPLTRDLHYEYSALAALLASLVAGFGVVRLSAREDGRPAEILWRRIGYQMSLAMIPLAVSLALAPLGDACGLEDGVVWYLLLVPPSALIGTIVGSFAVAVARGRIAAAALFMALWSVSLLRGAYEGYTGPHIFMYAWQIGFFPGGSWDAELPITPLLVAYRAAHVVVAVLLGLVIVELTRARRGDPAHAAPARAGSGALVAAGLIAGAAGLALVASRAELGLTRTTSWLRAELGDSVRIRHATIYYNAPTTDSLSLWRAMKYADFYIEEHALALGMWHDAVEPVNIYLYSSPAEQKRMVGTASAAFTKPWLRTVNMTFDGVGGTLRHELAHILMAPHGGVLGISISQGMLEGSAMALENEYGWRTLHQYARALYGFELGPPIEELMAVGGGFASYRSSVSYVLAGSFSRWLIERYGMRKYLAAFPWGGFEGAYGRTLAALAADYRAFIDTMPKPDPSELAAMRHGFGGGSFFAQRCLRRIGTLNARGYEALAEERYDRALLAFRDAMRDGINYGSRAGVVRALWGLGRFAELLDSCRSYARDTAGYPLLPYLIEQGDAHWALGDTAGARRLYDSAFALDINEGISFRAALRRYFLDAARPGSPLHRIMRQYFTRPARAMQRLAMLDAALAEMPGAEPAILLRMMRATWTASAYPVTTMMQLDIPDDVLRDSTLAHLPPRTAFIVSALAGRLHDAAMYVAAIREEPTFTFNPLALAFARPIAPTPASRAYLDEQHDEALRFLRFLDDRQVMP